MAFFFNQDLFCQHCSSKYVSTLVAKLHCAVCTIRQNFSMSELFHPKFCVLKAAHFNKKIFLKVGLSKPKRPMLKKAVLLLLNTTHLSFSAELCSKS